MWIGIGVTVAAGLREVAIKGNMIAFVRLLALIALHFESPSRISWIIPET